MPHTDKTALVTGASSGFGNEMARDLASRGFDLIAVARRKDKLEAAANEIRTEYQCDVRSIIADLSRPAAPREVYETATDLDKEINLLVNDAGFGVWGNLTDTDMEKEVAMLRVNCEAVLRLTKLFLPDMVEQDRGTILNVASTTAFQPGPLMANYYASKAYVFSLSEALRHELKETDVSVTTLCPGAANTCFPERADAEHIRLFTLLAPRNPTPKEVAKAGIRGALSGKRIVIPGIANKISSYLARVVPVGLSSRIARFFNSTG